MQGLQLLFENSPWWILLGIGVGVLYGLLLYVRGQRFKNASWGMPINVTLLVLRAVLVSLLCLLIIGPFVKQIKNTVEPPVVVMAIDNSSSVAAVVDSAQLVQLTQRIDSATAALRAAGYTTEIRDFESLIPIDSLSFTHPSTDLDAVLRTVASDYEGRNLASVVLFSDGIYNRGASPTYRSYPFTINTVGLGDTTAQQDASVSNLFYNKIAYQGNKFPLVAEITSTGLAEETLTVSVRQGKATLDSRTIKPAKQREVHTIEFLLEANREGLQHYVVTIESQADEFTLQNNEAHAYVEVIEGKENILLLAQAPHPDIKALRLAIASNQNYDFTSLILSTDQVSASQLEATKFDLVILHQLSGRGQLPQEVQTFLKSTGARWHIVGSQTDLADFNAANDVLEVTSAGRQTDEVRATYRNDFRGFQLTDDYRATIEQLLPLSVPFGEISLKNGATPILYQQVGKVTTSKPLLAVADTDQGKSAVLLAEGIWKWRQQEYARNGNTDATDALISKLIQYLSAKEDKRRFKVYPTKREFLDNEPVVFETELYNEVYEEVYGTPIELIITAEDSTRSNYNYTTNQSNTQYQVSNLPEGVYQYRARASIDGVTLTSQGNFSVRSLQIESLDLTANHALLRNLAQENGGAYYEASNLLTPAIVSNKTRQEKIYTSELFLPLINLKWLFFVLLALVAAEWGIRKYMGSY